ncbi:MAG: YXWGXW repeat-containing protein [Candidatus Omnitrophica bacterium]|nr:YXWGXW repeat-containing protein [Candidatus Omnitrophota bacterium]MDE2010295.1 YXWGXW repeat-containing protein [Candidatus Omnitrophota bacterium]
MVAFLAAPQLSYAEWGIGIHFGSPGPRPVYYNGYYRWHDHPHWGVRVRFLPAGHVTVWVGWHRYYYYDGLYYRPVNGGYVVCQPPAGAYVRGIPSDFQPAVINGVTYYTDNGVYYILTPHGYKVVAAPVVAVVPAPPQPQVEVIGVAPYRGAVWVKGHWAWRPRFGRYVWIRGHWR